MKHCKRLLFITIAVLMFISMASVGFAVTTDPNLVSIDVPASINLHIGGDNNNYTFTDTIDLSIRNEGRPITLESIEFHESNWDLVPADEHIGLNEKKLRLTYKTDDINVNITSSSGQIKLDKQLNIGNKLEQNIEYSWGTWDANSDAEEAFTITMNYSPANIELKIPTMRDLGSNLNGITRLHIGIDTQAPEGATDIVDISDLTEDLPESLYFARVGTDGYVYAPNTRFFKIESGKTLNTGECTYVEIGGYVKDTTSCFQLFNGNQYLTEVNLKDFDATKVESMKYMFNATNIQTVDFSTSSTPGLTDICSIFQGCKNLSTLNLNGLTTNNVTTALRAFQEVGLETLDLSRLDFGSCEDLGGFIHACENLKVVTLPSNINKVTNLSSAFNQNPKLTTINGLADIDTSHVKLMTSTFSANTSLTNFEDIKNWDVSSCESFSNMFGHTGGVQALDLSSWNAPQVIKITNMFIEANFTSIDLSSFYTPSLREARSAFENCQNLEVLKLNKLQFTNSGETLDSDYMFRGCYSLISVNLSSFNTSESVTDLHSMFYDCKSLNRDTFSINTQSAKDIGYMFYGCSNITKLDLSNWDTSKINRFDSCFENMENLEELNLSSWDTSGTYGQSWAYKSYKLRKITVGNKATHSFLCQFPTQKSSYIPGATGKWYSSDGTEYDRADIPEYKADTYTAVPVTRMLLKAKKPQIIFQDSEGNGIVAYPLVDSGLEGLYPEDLSDTGYWGEPEEDDLGNLIIQWYEGEENGGTQVIEASQSSADSKQSEASEQLPEGEQPEEEENSEEGIPTGEQSQVPTIQEPIKREESEEEGLEGGPEPISGGDGDGDGDSEGTESIEGEG